MMTDWLRPLLMMFYAPARGMAEARDRAPLGPAVVLASLAQSAYIFYVMWPSVFDVYEAAAGGFGKFTSILWMAISTVLFSAIVLVPIVIFIANLLERRASLGIALQQEYAATASAILYARIAACLIALPLAVLARLSGFEASVFAQSRPMLEDMARQQGTSAQELLALNPLMLQESFALTLMLPLFAVWLVIALREVFRLSWGRALLLLLASGMLMLPASAVLGWFFSRALASPFLLLLLFFLMRGYLGEVLRGQRARANFKQNLEAATLNPADASAHYNLGLIHTQRKEFDEARARFERAVEIDADELDAHYQLGRIARAQSRLPDAIKHFSDVIARDPTHAQHEVWREVGATYVHAGQFADARDALERFLDRRQSDPEGLYLMGRALFGMGRRREAFELMQACIEAVKTAPAYKYRAEKRWLNEAQQFLRSQA